MRGAYVYDPAHDLRVTAELPLVVHVLEAFRERPCLSLRLNLDPALVGSVLAEARLPALPKSGEVRAIAVSALDAGLLDAMVRLLLMLDSPTEAPFLAPFITRELFSRLWRCEQGDRLSHLGALSGQRAPIIRGIERLHKEYAQPLRIDTMAHELVMSASGLHHRFKAVMALSPCRSKSVCGSRRLAG